MKKRLKHVPVVSATQADFCRKHGVNVDGCTVTVAKARLSALLEEGFHGQREHGSPTDKQIAFAKKFGYEIGNLPRWEADAIVDDLMYELNHEAIERERLIPGVRVTNIHDATGEAYVISSVTDEGIVYFKGGNGRHAWARNLRSIKTE